MTIYPDEKLQNADWPKRTPDTIQDLEKQVEKITKETPKSKGDLKSIRSKYKSRKLK